MKDHTKPSMGENPDHTGPNDLNSDRSPDLIFKGTVMQIEKVLINDRLGVSKVS